MDHVSDEQELWSPINRQLRQHGLQTINIHRDQSESYSGEVVMLDHGSVKSLRQSLSTLMLDCERRQALVQDLILSNNQLKEDHRHVMEENSHLDEKVRDLKKMLDSARYRIKELEEDDLLEHSRLEDEAVRQQSTKYAAQTQCRKLERKVKLQEEEIERLREKVQRITLEDEKRLKRNRAVFEKLGHHSAKSRGLQDDRFVELIDAYELEIERLQQELDGGRSVSHDRESRNETLQHYKKLVQSYERQIHDTKRAVRDQEDKNDLLKLELDSRPLMKDFRSLQQKVKHLEKILAKNNISITSDKLSVADHKKYSTQLDDIDYLPLDHCRRHLRTLCSKAGVTDLRDIPPMFEQQAHPQLEEFAKDVLEIVNSPSAPDTPDHIPTPTKKTHAVWCEKAWAHVIPTLEFWLEELASLQELCQSVKRLSTHLSPEKIVDFPEDWRLIDLVEAVDSLSTDTVINLDKVSKGKAAPGIMSDMVGHFQKLFDVPNLSGVYPRMNEIYTKLGESHNVLSTLKNLLGLDPNCRSSQVVEGVGRLCQLNQGSAAQQLDKLLKEDDLHAVLQKLDMHEEFFPVFEEVMTRLMDILQVSRVEQVVPAVRALKLLHG